MNLSEQTDQQGQPSYDADHKYGAKTAVKIKSFKRHLNKVMLVNCQCKITARFTGLDVLRFATQNRVQFAIVNSLSP